MVMLNPKVTGVDNFWWKAFGFILTSHEPGGAVNAKNIHWLKNTF